MMRGMAREAKLSARRLRYARSSEKDAALRFVAEGIEARKEEIGKINAQDVSLEHSVAGFGEQLDVGVAVGVEGFRRAPVDSLKQRNTDFLSRK